MDSFGQQYQYGAFVTGETSKSVACPAGSSGPGLTITCDGANVTSSGYCLPTSWTPLTGSGMCISNILTFPPHYTKTSGSTDAECRAACVIFYFRFIVETFFFSL